jgi:beta-lactamase class A
MRTILGHQVWPHRLASGFPETDFSTSGKTGTLLGWRNEAGVVQKESTGERVAVACFTRNYAFPVKNFKADAAIGASARVAVDRLTG